MPRDDIRGGGSARRPRRAYTPRVEGIENRELMTASLVTITNGSRPGSLRQVIITAAP